MSALQQEFFTPKELADMFRVTPRTVARLVEAGDITATKIGGSTRFQREDVERYIASQKLTVQQDKNDPIVVPDVQPMKRVVYWSQESPIGALTIMVSDNGLCRIAFPDEDTAAILADLSRPNFGKPAIEAGRDTSVSEQLDEYFAGERTAFELPIDWSLVTAGRRPYVYALMEIPYGSTVAYKDIAARVGKPRGAQAAGQAVGNNSIPIVAPCHRVLAADGSLGGYGGGLSRKRFLLQLEGLGEFEGGWQKRRRAEEGLPD